MAKQLLILSILIALFVCSNYEDQFESKCEKKVEVSKPFGDNIHLPWMGVSKPISLSVTGGCATTYMWISSDADIASVTGSGDIHTKKPGEVTITVISPFDRGNFDKVDLKFTIPSQMIMLKIFPVEVLVGQPIQAAVSFKGSDGSYYSSCDSLHSVVTWDCPSAAFILHTPASMATLLDYLEKEGIESLYATPCAWTYILAAHVDTCLLQATLYMDSQQFSSPDSFVLTAHSRIASYPPLGLYQIADGNRYGGYTLDSLQAEGMVCLNMLIKELYLVPGSELNIRVAGGPRRWDHSVEFVQDVDIFHNDVLVDHQSTSMELIYKVACSALGNFRLVFTCGNLVGDDHAFPAIAKVKLSLSCALPVSIVMILNEPANTLDLIKCASQAKRGPRRLHIARAMVINGGTYRIATVGIHRSGKVFANCSSLVLKWELRSCKGLVYWETAAMNSSMDSWERFLVVEKLSRMCTVRATVTGFSDVKIGGFSEDAFTMFEVPKTILTDAIRLQVPLGAEPFGQDWRKAPGILSYTIAQKAGTGMCNYVQSVRCAEAEVRLSTGFDVSLSIQHAVDCTYKIVKKGRHHMDPFVSKGSKINDTAFFIKNTGLATEDGYPRPLNGTPQSCLDDVAQGSRYHVNFEIKLKPTLEELKRAVDLHPVVIAVNAGSDFTAQYKKGKVYFESDQADVEDEELPPLNHALLVVGYRDDVPEPYIIVQNSYGATWGEYGFGRISQRGNSMSFKTIVGMPYHLGNAQEH